MGRQDKLRRLESQFDEAVSDLTLLRNDLYTYQGKISALKEELGKPTKKGKLSRASRLNKAANAAQQATSFVKWAIDKGGIDYASWLSQGTTITDDFDGNFCPFCGKPLSVDVEKYEALKTMRVSDLEPLLSSSTILEQFGVDPRKLETEEGAGEVRRRLLLLYKVSDKVNKVIKYCNAPKDSLMANGVPELVVDECVYEFFPELREPVSAVVSRTNDLKRLFGDMKNAFNSVIKENCINLNNGLSGCRSPIGFQLRLQFETKRQQITVCRT